MQTKTSKTTLGACEHLMNIYIHSQLLTPDNLTLPYPCTYYLPYLTTLTSDT